MNRMLRGTVWISIAGVLAVAAYAAFAAVQILVLNPLAAVPGLTLDEIRFEMSSAGESFGQVQAFIVLGIGVVLALVLAIISIRTRVHPLVPAMGFLSLLMLGAVGYFIASFSAGMGLADTFGISGGDYSRWSRLLYAASLLAGVALIVGAIVTVVRRRPTAVTA